MVEGESVTRARDLRASSIGTCDCAVERRFNTRAAWSLCGFGPAQTRSCDFHPFSRDVSIVQQLQEPCLSVSGQEPMNVKDCLAASQVLYGKGLTPLHASNVIRYSDDQLSSTLWREVVPAVSCACGKTAPAANRSSPFFFSRGFASLQRVTGPLIVSAKGRRSKSRPDMKVLHSRMNPTQEQPAKTSRREPSMPSNVTASLRTLCD